jgi:hypothetical protein
MIKNEYDLSACFCPHCGSGFITVLQAPNPDGWWDRIGKAKCDACKRNFSLILEPTEETNVGFQGQ